MQFPNAKNIQKTLFREFMKPLLFSIVTFSICYLILKDKLPTNLSKGEWENFTQSISHSINALQTYEIIFFLMCMQFIHIICMIPFVEISQMLMGYYVGFVFGGSICFIWDFCIVFGFIYVRRNRIVDLHDTKFPIFISYLRGHNLLYVFLFLVFNSYFPLNSTYLIIASGDVSLLEYICVHCIVSCINIYKNTYIGYNISLSITSSNIILLEYFVLFLTILPIFLTLLVMNFVGNFYAYLETVDQKLLKSEKHLVSLVYIDKPLYYFFFSISNSSQYLLSYLSKIRNNTTYMKMEHSCNQDDFVYLLTDIVKN